MIEGYVTLDQEPFISIHFNKNGYLYTVMNSYFKNTITGYVMGMLDYYLKSFLNGSYFTEEFIINWENEKNLNPQFL